MSTETPLPADQARNLLDALLGKKVRATVTHSVDGTPRIIEGTLTTEIGLYTVEDATVRYPGSTVHVDNRNLLAVEEIAPPPASIDDAAQIAHDLILRRTGDDTELADIIRAGIHDAYRVGLARGHDAGPDAWDVSRMEHETDALRDRVAELEKEVARLRTRQEYATEDWCIPAGLPEVIDRFEERFNPWPTHPDRQYIAPIPGEVRHYIQRMAPDIARVCLEQADLQMRRDAEPDPADGEEASPRDEYDPRTEVEAQAGGDLEQFIAAWEDDQAQRRAHVRALEEENSRLRRLLTQARRDKWAAR